MSGEYDLHVIQIALRRGFLTRERAAAFLLRASVAPATHAGSGPSPGPLLDELVAAGELSADQADEVRRAVRAESSPQTVGAVSALQPLATPGGTILPPERLGGYRLLGIIGSGGMGIVYEAEQLAMGRRVALKVLTPILAGDPKALERFRREARAAGRLDHPGIVAVHDVGEEYGLHFYAMEKVEGTTLDALVLKGPLPPRSAAELGAQAADALHYAHTHGIVHRDIKPGNLILTAAGRLKVMDFGIAKGTEAGTLTASGMMVGTPCYMSPEQAEGAADAVDARSDVYSLGATLYELITGKKPFAGESMDAVLAQIFLNDPAPVSAVAPACPRDLEVIVHKAMAKEPECRYASAQELADDLRRFLAGEPIRARPRTRLAQLARRVRRYWFFWLLAAFMTLVAGSAVFFAGRTLRDQAREEEAWARAAERARERERQREAARHKVQEGVFLKGSGTQLALARFADALAIDPECYDAYLERARCYKEQARYAEAIPDLARAIQLQPKAADAYVERAKISICRRDFVSALFDIGMIRKITPNHPYLLTAAGAVAYLQGVRADALAGFDAAIRRDPKSAIAYAFRGSLLLSDRDPARRAEAARDIQRALELEPQNAVALHAQALYCLMQRDFDQASRYATMAVQSDRVFPEAYIALAKAAVGQGKLDAALDALESATRYGPNHAEGFAVRALVLLRRGEPARAIPDAERARILGGDEELARHLRAVALARAGRGGEARAEVEAIERTWRESTLAVLARAEVYLEEDRLDEALAAVEKVLKEIPTSGQALALRGRIRLARKEGVTAADDIKRAVALDPSLWPEIQACIKAREAR